MDKNVNVRKRIAPDGASGGTTRKAELINRQGPWRTSSDVEVATATWVHRWNTPRLHSACGDIPPAEHEAA